MLVVHSGVLAEDKSDFNLIGEWFAEAPNGDKITYIFKKNGTVDWIVDAKTSQGGTIKAKYKIDSSEKLIAIDIFDFDLEQLEEFQFLGIISVKDKNTIQMEGKLGPKTSNSHRPKTFSSEALEFKSRITALRAEVEKIVSGKSDVKEVRAGDKTLKIGDTATISKWEWVDVMNLTPVKSANNSFVFKDLGSFDSCGVDNGGTIKILGFSDDKARALVEYTLPKGVGARGTRAPSGIQYFLPVAKFTQMKQLAEQANSMSAPDWWRSIN